MKSKFFPLNIHIGLHFESSAEKSGKFQGEICWQIHAHSHLLISLQTAAVARDVSSFYARLLHCGKDQNMCRSPL